MDIKSEAYLIKTFFSDQRNWTWNFKPLDTYGTIECRKPPMSANVDDVLCWVELVTCTALAACNTDNTLEDLLKFRHSCTGFKLFIQKRRELLYSSAPDLSNSKLSSLFGDHLMDDFEMRTPASYEDKIKGVFA
jgi:hypothetical protein